MESSILTINISRKSSFQLYIVDEFNLNRQVKTLILNSNESG